MSELTNTDSSASADFSLLVDGLTLKVTAIGDWSLATIATNHDRLVAALDSLEYENVDYDFDGVTNLDTAGAYILAKAIRSTPDVCFPYELRTQSRGHQVLMREAADATIGRPAIRNRQWFDILVRMGKATEHFFAEVFDTLAFLGRFVTALFRQLLTPHTIRWKSVVAHIEDVGLNAAPIIMTLSFFVGAVIAYMGANLLASLGFQVYMVDLIGFAVLREFAVIITAILLAGRSDSAFTAQIGSMKMRQEIDAMEIIGLDRFEALVVPRALACMLSAPILTFLAMISGMAGGLIVAWTILEGISPTLFLARLQAVVEPSHFWVGMVKAPVFGLVIAIIGCRQGLAVTGSVESLGSRTTKSVVQAIFAIIFLDAMFAIMFYQMGV
ncbi:MAG: ABC transporter permease [Hellea sp.]|nr:ABC transporter permease [Hellea sp.]